MRRPDRPLALAALLVGFAGCGWGGGASAGAGEAAARDAVTAAEARLRDAMLAADTVRLALLLAPEYLSTSAVGHTSSRSESLLAYGAGLVRVDSATVRDLDLRVYGATVVSLGRLDWAGVAAGLPFAGLARFQRVWVRQPDGRWLLVASQLTGQPPRPGRRRRSRPATRFRSPSRGAWTSLRA